MKFPKLVGNVTGRQFLAVFFSIFSSARGFADVTMLETTGPRTGSLFSNPGVVAAHLSTLKVSMASADVKIFVHRGKGEELAAECDASFVLKDRSNPASGSHDFLVAFPVTGMNSKIVTVDSFSVLVEGNAPQKVFRNTVVVVSPWETKSTDPKFSDSQPIAELYPEDHDTIMRSDENWYRNAFVWLQTSKPGTITHVHISYTATLRPQSIYYAKAYSKTFDDEVLPFDDNPASKWDQRYYFFDYILISGSTWFGAIGKETINLTLDPELHIAAGAVESGLRRPVGSNPRLNRIEDHSRYSEGPENTEWEIEGKPSSDIVFAIPVRQTPKQ